MATRSRAERESVDVVLAAEELAPTLKVGTLRFSRARTDLPVSFEYDAAWLDHAHRFQLDPRLELFAGEQHPPAKDLTFGILQDAAPDRWGRMLMERREGVLARREGRKARRLGEMDFLLGVHDPDCVDLAPTGAELAEALPWVALQDANPDWPAHVAATLADLGRRLGHGL